jgi:hypothetical protein
MACDCVLQAGAKLGIGLLHRLLQVAGLAIFDYPQPNDSLGEATFQQYKAVLRAADRRSVRCSVGPCLEFELQQFTQACEK